MEYSLSKRIRFHRAANEAPNSLFSLLQKLPKPDLSKLLHMVMEGSDTKEDGDFLSKLCHFGETCLKLSGGTQAPARDRDIPIPNDIISHFFAFLPLQTVAVCAAVNRRWCDTSLRPSSYLSLTIDRCKTVESRPFVLQQYCERFSKIKILLIDDASRMPGLIHSLQDLHFTNYLTRTKSLHTLRLNGKVFPCDRVFMKQNYKTLRVLEAGFCAIECLHELPNLTLVKLREGHEVKWSNVIIPGAACPSVQALEIKGKFMGANRLLKQFLLGKFHNVRFFFTMSKLVDIDELSYLPNLEFLRLYLGASRTMGGGYGRNLESLCKHSPKLSHVQISLGLRVPSFGDLDTYGVKFEILPADDFTYIPRGLEIVFGNDIGISCDGGGDAVLTHGHQPDLNAFLPHSD